MRKFLGIPSGRPGEPRFATIGSRRGLEHARMLRNLGPVSTAVDIGASRGQFALVARHCSPEGESYTSSRWQAMFSDDACGRLLEAAVESEKGEVEIHLSERDDSSSLLPITERQVELFRKQWDGLLLTPT